MFEVIAEQSQWRCCGVAASTDEKQANSCECRIPDALFEREQRS